MGLNRNSLTNVTYPPFRTYDTYVRVLKVVIGETYRKL